MAANTLGRYTIIRELARSNDIVYEAMDPRGGKRIALKELQMAGNLVGQARHERIQRFTREARAAASLKHTNIVQILDHGQVPGPNGPRYYIAMEFLEGQSLRDLLRLRGSLPLQESLRIAALVADGLDYAHSRGVVHRDVKPDNVHLEPDGRVVITDFGIARLTFEPTLTADGQIFGTPSYMSPEQVKGGGIDKRSDVFSLGVMLYEMVAGRKPFTGDSVVTITYNIMNVDPPPVLNAPPGVEQIVRKAIAKDAGQRYASAAQMAEDLRAVMGGGSPRHASAPLPPAYGQSGARPGSGATNGRSNGGPPGYPARPPAPAPSAAPRPIPATAGAYPPPQYGYAAPPAGIPGARPLPQARVPAGSAYGGGFAAAPAPVPPRPAPPVYQPQPRYRDSGGGTDLKWFFGWLGVAVVIGVMILALVWAGVTSYDKVRNDGAARAAQARKQDAVERVNAANQELDRGKSTDAAKAVALARKALELRPGYPSALLALGRALALQGKTQDALDSLDQAVTIAEGLPNTPGVTDTELSEAREAAKFARQWKANTLYEDGVKQSEANPSLARQRFEEVEKLVPNTVFSRNAAEQLRRLPASGTGAAGAPSTSTGFPDPNLSDPGGLLGGPRAGTPGGPMADPGPANPPPGWDPNYGLGPATNRPQ